MASEDTRQRLLRAAERLFAQRGVEAVSLRQVGVEAGQRHNSATQYHFGTKPALVAAIFSARMTGINARRRAMLMEIGPDDPKRVEKLVRVLVEPLADLIAEQEGGCDYVRFIGQLARDPNWSFSADLAPELSVGFALALREMDRALSTRMPKRVRAARIGLLANQVGDALSRRASQQELPTFEGPSHKRFVDQLVDYMVAALDCEAYT